jgi:hypothetical protein
VIEALLALVIGVLVVALVVEEANRRLTRPVPWDDTSRGSGKAW